MKPKRPSISIITVVYNGEDYIESTIQSVLSQTYTDYEYLIVDGESSDNTLKIIKSHQNALTKVISEKDKGVYDGMNKGLKLASGNYLLFLNAGDELTSPETLQLLFNADHNADLIYGETLIMNPKREVLGTRSELTSRKLPSELKKEDFLNGQVVSHQSFIPRRSLCSTYNLNYGCSSDIDWMLNFMNECTSIYQSDQPISKYLQGGISDRNLKKCWMERFQIMIRHFNPLIVLLKHIQFGLRYLRIGAYRSAINS